MKVTARLSSVLMALSVCLSACGPRTVGEGYQPGSDSEVLIDQLGIPHIYAETDADAFYASGYVLASLRLFQIDLVRRQALGRLAEVLGPGALRDDIAARAFSFRELGRADRERIMAAHPRDAELGTAFVTGINRFIERVRDGTEETPAPFRELDYRPERWSEEDLFAIGKMLSFGMSQTLDYDILATLLSRLAPRVVQELPLCMPVRSAFVRPQALGGPPRPGGAPFATPYPPLAQPQAGALAGYRRLTPALGSNNWAVAGKHTENGRPLLAGDPHQPLGSPLRFYAQHLSSAHRGGSLDVIGFSFAGTPGVQLGHNRKVAWTATTNYADVMDLWDVEFAPGKEEILLGGKGQRTVLRKERVRVRRPGGKVEEGDLVEVELTDVPGVGVLLPDELLPVPRGLLVRGHILFAWTGFLPTTEAGAYLGLDRAGSVEEVEAAMRRLEVGAVNLISADSRSISYYVHARVPDRGDPAARPLPWRILDGRDASTLWTGAYLGEDKLPRARDPERGYLVSANNDPWGFTADGRVDNDPFYYGFFYDPGDRAARIESELKARIAAGKVSREDMRGIQNDAYIQLADDLLPPLSEALLAIGTDESLRAYRNRPELFTLFSHLAGWDRQMRRGSSAAVIFFAFAHFALRGALADEFGPALYAILEAEPAYAMKALRLILMGKAPSGQDFLKEGRNLVLVAALAETAEWLRARFGGLSPERYAWRDLHGVSFRHVLGGRYDGGVVPVDGSIGTVNVSSSTLFAPDGTVRERVTAADGPIHRMVIGFDEDGTPRAEVAFPRGNSEDPRSPHFNDQTLAWVEGEQVHLPFRRSDVERAATRRFVVLREGGTR